MKKEYLKSVNAEMQMRIKKSREKQMAENQKRWDELKKIKAFANHMAYTDVNPYEVVRKISDITVEIRALRTEQVKSPSDFHPGGFVGHYSDNRSGQDYTYHSNPENSLKRIRWSKPKKGWYDPYGRRFVMADKPYKFYDYNF